ncbi:MAG: multidrug transporter [Proteobacteria bacterium]|nr:MAG: multidrug transporter [Pseudomonadota bacterium]
MKRRMHSAVALAVLTALSGCTLAPRYERPAAPVADEFPAQPSANAGEGLSAADIGWREFFPQQTLQDLIGRALANNRDLRVAALNVEAARAQYRIRQADIVPHVDAVGEGNSQRVPANLSQTGESYVTRQYSAGLGVTAFELDLFGRLRSLRRGALETYLSLEETRLSAELALIAEVANAWLTLVADQELLRLTRETYEVQRSSYDLTRLRFDSGVASEVDLHQAEIALRNAEVNISVYERRVAQDRNALELLVGEPLGPEFDPSGASLDEQVLAHDIPAGLPAELLERRPDIRAAEHALRAANANIGAARAAFFPRISLTGFYGEAHPDLSDLFSEGQRTWSFVPQIRVPIFAGGANAAQLDLAQVRKRAEIARYEQAIQVAFREVADALAARSTLDAQLRAQEALTRAAENTYRLADMRYRNGVESYLTTLIAQRDFYAAQQALINTRLARASNLVLLYKALGGGWREHSE